MGIILKPAIVSKASTGTSAGLQLDIGKKR
jgi:hypothetical protein